MFSSEPCHKYVVWGRTAIDEHCQIYAQLVRGGEPGLGLLWMWWRRRASWFVWGARTPVWVKPRQQLNLFSMVGANDSRNRVQMHAYISPVQQRSDLAVSGVAIWWTHYHVCYRREKLKRCAKYSKQQWSLGARILGYRDDVWNEQWQSHSLCHNWRLWSPVHLNFPYRW